MKKLFYLILLLVSGCGVAFGQADIQRSKPVGSDPASTGVYNKSSVRDANLTAVLNLRIPVMVAFSIKNAKDSIGYIAYSTNLQKFGVYKGGGNWASFSDSTSLVTALNLKVDKTTTLTINGVTYNLSANRSWTIPVTDTSSLSNRINLKVNKADSNQLNVVGGYATPLYANNASPRIPGTNALSSTPSIGDSPGTNLTAAAWIQAEFYKTSNPTGSLTGGTQYELRTSSVTHNLSYSYGRTNLNTNPISSAVINPGSFNVFTSSPVQGSSNSGTQSVTTATNTNTTYTVTINTSDSKTASYTTTDTFLPMFYYFRSATGTPSQSEILAIAGGASFLSGSHTGTYTISASGSNYPSFAYAASQGAVTRILDVNGFDVTSSFNTGTLSFTNASGYNQTFRWYSLNSATGSNYQITIQ